MNTHVIAGPLVPILVVSRHESDAVAIKTMLRGTKYLIAPESCLGHAQKLMSHIVFPVVLFDRHFDGDDWQTPLSRLVNGWQAPVAVLLSEPCEAGFWEESVCRGAFDVLIRPFSPASLIPTLDLAHTHWKLGLRADMAVR